MWLTIVFVITMLGSQWPGILFAGEDQPPQQPSARERLNQVLDHEGGIQVYKDHQGNVETVIDPPGGNRIMTVQPPASPSMNLGPPLQLHNQTFQPPSPPPTPAHPPVPDFPQKAR